jgi:outer membrane lipoprotein
MDKRRPMIRHPCTPGPLCLTMLRYKVFTMKTLVLLMLCALLITGPGCAPTFSRELLDRVNTAISFRDLQKKPDQYQGEWVMLGGLIIEIRNTPDGSLVEVLQRPLDRRGRPHETDQTEGRFLFKTDEFLDPAVHQRGKLLSIIGQVSGQTTRPLGEMQYRYPVVTARELRLWEPRTSPQFSFGIGVYHQF